MKRLSHVSKTALVDILCAEIRQERLPIPAKEVRFHPVRKWRFDVAWPHQKVGLEIHGGVYVQGRHTRGKGFEEDREKINEAQLLGWTVLEYSTGQVKDGKPILDLKRLFQ